MRVRTIASSDANGSSMSSSFGFKARICAMDARFTGSGWTDETDELARGNFELYIFDDGFLAITHRKIDNAQHLTSDNRKIEQWFVIRRWRQEARCLVCVRNAIGGGEVDLHIVGIKRAPVTFQYRREPITIAAGDQFLRQRGHRIL